MTTPAPPVRFCPFCKQADTDPRHDYGVGDPEKQPHLDCCAANGCPDGSCPILVADKKESGDAFRALLTDDAYAKKTARELEKRDDATRGYTSAQAAELLGIDPNTIVPVSLQGVSQ